MGTSKTVIVILCIFISSVVGVLIGELLHADDYKTGFKKGYETSKTIENVETCALKPYYDNLTVQKEFKYDLQIRYDDRIINITNASVYLGD